MRLRPLTRDDFALLATWLEQPHVARWWHHETTPEAVERDFGPAVDGAEPSEELVVELDGRAVGLVQWYRFDAYPEYVSEIAAVVEVPEGATSIDYLLGEPDVVGRGVGRSMIGELVEHVWRADATATCVVVPVHRDNHASWRALVGAGFRIVGYGELEPDNPADDRSHVVLRLDRPVDRTA